jgi:hypothetical protein
MQSIGNPETPSGKLEGVTNIRRDPNSANYEELDPRTILKR